MNIRPRGLLEELVESGTNANMKLNFNNHKELKAIDRKLVKKGKQNKYTISNAVIN